MYDVLRQQILHGILRKAPLGIIVLDSAITEVIEYNPRAAELLGYLKGDLLGKNGGDLFPADTREATLKRLHRAIQDSVGCDCGKLQFKRGDGELVLLQTWVHPVRLADRDWLWVTVI